MNCFCRQIGICLLLYSQLSLANAQTAPDQTEYLKNVIKRARDASGVQQPPEVQGAPGSTTTSTTVPSAPQATTAPSSNTAASVTPTTVPPQTNPAATAATAPTNNLANIRHGELPTSRDYWRFLNYYRNHAVVSLVVSGVDEKGLLLALDEVSRLQSRGIQIGEVVVTGGKYIAELNSAGLSTEPPVTEALTSEEDKLRKTILNKKPSPLSKLSRTVGLGIGEPVDLTPMMKRLDIRYSPTWVVRFHGSDFVYEGLDSPSALFTKDGVFKGANR